MDPEKRNELIRQSVDVTGVYQALIKKVFTAEDVIVWLGQQDPLGSTDSESLIKANAAYHVVIKKNQFSTSHYLDDGLHLIVKRPDLYFTFIHNGGNHCLPMISGKSGSIYPSIFDAVKSQTDIYKKNPVFMYMIYLFKGMTFPSTNDHHHHILKLVKKSFIISPVMNFSVDYFTFNCLTPDRRTPDRAPDRRTYTSNFQRLIERVNLLHEKASIYYRTVIEKDYQLIISIAFDDCSFFKLKKDDEPLYDNFIAFLNKFPKLCPNDFCIDRCGDRDGGAPVDVPKPPVDTPKPPVDVPKPPVDVPKTLNLLFLLSPYMAGYICGYPIHNKRPCKRDIERIVNYIKLNGMKGYIDMIILENKKNIQKLAEIEWMGETTIHSQSNPQNFLLNRIEIYSQFDVIAEIINECVHFFTRDEFSRLLTERENHWNREPLLKTTFEKIKQRNKVSSEIRLPAPIPLKKLLKNFFDRQSIVYDIRPKKDGTDIFSLIYALEMTRGQN